jgi:hypothetical protein
MAVAFFFFFFLIFFFFVGQTARHNGTPKGTQKNVKKKTSFAATPSSGQIWNFMQKFPFLAQKRGNFILLFVDRYSIFVQARERGEEEGRMGGRRAYEKKGTHVSSSPPFVPFSLLSPFSRYQGTQPCCVAR